MSQRNTRHDTFVIERTYPASPARVFNAWADPEAKARWFAWATPRISVSLATVDLLPAGSGTRLIFTEQAVFLDGADAVSERERGTRDLLERLGAALTREPANT
jgi:uncharacterized protein YndB with AHSA1/START domain